MKIGTLIIKRRTDINKPIDCIAADGKWYTKDQHPGLYEIFKDCSCLMPKTEDITGIVQHEPSVKGIFHVPNSHGKAWIVCNELN